MTPNQKIASVFNHIKNESEISPNPKLVEFKFNDHVVGFGIVAGVDERKILLKLQKENVIKIQLMPYHEDNIYKLNYKLEDFIFKADKVLVQTLDNFSNHYNRYRQFLELQEDKNYWNYVNPLWLFWKSLLLFWKFLQLAWKHKIISLVVTIVLGFITLMTSDYSKIGENIDKLQQIFN